MRYLLLGALLPDATRFTIILVDVLDWPAIPTFTYLIPFHSLLIMALLAGAIALLLPAANESSRKAFGLIMAGAAFHFLLDDLEGWVGCGSTSFYPFYFGKTFGGWRSEGNFALMLLVDSAVAIGVALGQRRQWRPLTWSLTRRRLFGVLALLFVAFITPLFFQQWMIERNAYYLAFITNPAAFEGQSVALCFSEVIAIEPPLVEEFDTSFELQTAATLTTGEWLSIRGIYQHGAIKPTILVHHQEFSDVGLSLIGAVAFVFLIFDFRFWAWFKRLKRMLV